MLQYSGLRGYLPRFLDFFFDFGVNGAGGVFSNRRSTSSGVGFGCGLGVALMAEGV